MRIRTKLLLVAGLPLIALLGLAGLFAATLFQVRINSPLYREIRQANDLVADVLPPPAYVIEPYLTVQQLADVTGDPQLRQGLLDRLSEQRAIYEQRYAFWEKTLANPGDPLRQRIASAMVGDAHATAERFFKVLDDELLPALQKGDQARVDQVISGDLATAFEAHRDAILVVTDLSRQLAASNEERATSLSSRRLLLTLFLVVGILALVLAIGALVVRAIARPVKRLTDAANHVAEHELPDVVARMQRGEDDSVSFGAASSAFDIGTEDELSDLAAAMSSMQSTAVALAVDQVRTRRNVAEMFVNLGRRNQNLLSRTLAFITELERNERDPDVLDDLFRLDHLATRMRRNAESLLVLAGADSARSWSTTVDVGDVVRSALSEIEAYDRVDLVTIDTCGLRGAVVADLTHLLAELIENATLYSPPTTRVRVIGRLGDEEYLLSVVDQGIGMTPAELTEANRRIEELARFDHVPSKVLGLYVVGRLAARHGISVRLVESMSEGVTAKVRLPLRVLVEASAESPAAPSGGAPVALMDVGPAGDVAAGAPTLPAGAGRDAQPVGHLTDSAAHGNGLRGSAPTGPARSAPPLPAPALPASIGGDGASLAAPFSASAPAGPSLSGHALPITPLPQPPARPPAAPSVTAAASDAANTFGGSWGDVAELATSVGSSGDDNGDQVPGGDIGVTRNGLRRRVKGAQMPDTGPAAAAPAQLPARSADDIRRALSSFQAGLSRAHGAETTSDDSTDGGVL